MKKIWVYGAGGHARVVYELIESSKAFEVVGFIDDDETRAGEVFLDYELITNMSNFEKANSEINVGNVFLAIGNDEMREKIAVKIKNYEFPTVIHSTAIISSEVNIGCGTVIMPGVVIEPGVNIGEHCIINNGAIIGHGSRIGDFCHISGNAVVSGEVVVGKGSLVAIGSCITPQVNVGEYCIIGAGSVISRNVPDGAKMMGNPARNIGKYK